MVSTIPPRRHTILLLLLNRRAAVISASDASDFIRMAVYNRTKVGFVYDTMSEFIHLWRSGVEATVKFECKDGKVAFSMSSGPLGYPEDRHPKVEVKKRRRKSANRTSRNNARAARYQAAQAALASHELTPSAARPVASPVLSTSQSRLVRMWRKTRAGCSRHSPTSAVISW